LSKLTINQEAQCVGCRQCELICSYKHEGIFSPWLARVRVVRQEEVVKSEAIICLHCDNPPCAAACPVDAIVKSDLTGAFYVDHLNCIGCLQCIEACPNGAMGFNNQRSIAQKCDLCGGDPACVKACPADVIRRVVKDNV